jgi:hypothetical protein
MTMPSRANQIRVVHGIPLQGGGRLYGAADPDSVRLRRRPCQARQHYSVDRCEAGSIVEIHAFDYISVGNAILHADVLVLADVVLVRFHDADAREAGVVERPVVSAPAEAVQPVDHLGVQVGEMRVRHAGHVAGQLPGHPVHFTALGAASGTVTVRFRHRRGLGEHPEGAVVDHAIDAFDVADHVVVEDAHDVPAFLHSPGRQMGAAPQTLFFP